MFGQLAGGGGLMQEFRRVVGLPEDVDPDRIQARCQDGIEASIRDGVLAIRIPKRAELKPRWIEVQTA